MPTSWPGSVASIVGPGSMADIGGPALWLTSEARHCGLPQGLRVACTELRGQVQGPPAAWPTCGPLRRRPSVSTTSRVPRPARCVWPTSEARKRACSTSRPASCVADIKAPAPKSRRRGQDELCLPPLHGTRGDAVEQPTPGVRVKARARRASARATVILFEMGPPCGILVVWY